MVFRGESTRVMKEKNARQKESEKLGYQIMHRPDILFYNYKEMKVANSIC